MIRLEARDLSVRIAQRSLCEDLHLRCHAGENWAILGANGSGKTSLLHTLAGLRRPQAGGVYLDGRPIAEYSPRDCARRRSILFQVHDLAFPATVFDTVLSGRYPHVPLWANESPQDYLCAQAALAAVGMETLGGRSLSTLSGGERRRAEIAAVLAQDAPIALWDEPTNHLDLHHQIRIMEILCHRATRAGHLNVFVLHDINLARRFCSHGLLLFADGSQQSGDLNQIVDTAVLEELYGHPFRRIGAADDFAYLPA